MRSSEFVKVACTRLRSLAQAETCSEIEDFERRERRAIALDHFETGKERCGKNARLE